MTDVSRTFHFSTVVWGPWHTSVFLDVNLPSLLASGNLEAFAKRHRVTYRIQTSHEDVARIEASPAYVRAKDLVDCRVIGRTIPRSIDPIAMHHMLWRAGIEDARRAGAMVLLVPPDVIWSSNAFGNVGELVASGKTAIFMTYVRVVSETAVDAVRARFRHPTTGIIDAPSRALVQLAMDHIHPLTLTYVRDSPNFPVHPEFILWPVEREGYLMRVLVREMFAYDPRQYDLNEQALLAHRPAADDVHYITDSDELFSLSLAPFEKDVEWYAAPQRLDPLKVGAWWRPYDSPANNCVAREYFYIHGTERTPELWRTAELQSDVLMRRIGGTRELLRVLSALSAGRHVHAEQVLATALLETKIARLIGGHDDAVTILLPNAAATFRRMLADDLRWSERGAARRLVSLLLDHVLQGVLTLKPGKDAVISTALGRERRLTWRGDAPLIDGVSMDPSGFALGRHWCHDVADVLPAARRLEFPVTTDRHARRRASRRTKDVPPLNASARVV